MVVWGINFLLIGIAIVAIITLVKFKKLKHELFAIFLIMLLLFGAFSFTMAFKGKNISFNSLLDLEKVAKIYFSWLSTAFGNIKIITAQVVNMNWQGNRTG